MIRLLTVLLVGFISVIANTSASANEGEQKLVFGDYEVHYIGLTTSFLTPEVATAYGIERSGKLAMLNISVLLNKPGETLPTAVASHVTGNMKNLIGQNKALEFREIKESNAIYYIAVFPFDDQETYRVDLDVSPIGSNRNFDVQFTQKLYFE